ncbi:MAG: AAA family ATPase [Ignavibacteria bacterium]|nr:AAA family ATPase [Ignavibacteria bacterium]
MIEKLYIKNYLIIKEAEIDFSKGLNILTGETGAGKSIILDALSMLLGERADYSIIKKDQDKLIIEGHFDFSFNKNIVSVVQEILPEDDFSNGVIIIRRELLKKGVSRNFINDNPVNISDMKKLGNSIVDIHSQNEHQSLLNKETHLGILDSFAANKDLLSGYLSILNELKSLIQNFQELSQKKDDIISKKTFLDFELKEINNLNLSYEEDTNLETDLNKLENVEDISTSLENSVNLLFENESNALSTVSLAIKELKKIVHFDKNIEKIIEDLESSYILIKESSESLINYRTELNFSSDRTDQIRERLSSINHLKRKYGMTVDELIRRSEKLSEELKLAENFDFETDKLLNKISLKREEVYKLAKNLSLIRIKRSKELEKGINLLLRK